MAGRGVHKESKAWREMITPLAAGAMLSFHRALLRSHSQATWSGGEKQDLL